MTLCVLGQNGIRRFAAGMRGTRVEAYAPLRCGGVRNLGGAKIMAAASTISAVTILAFRMIQGPQPFAEAVYTPPLVQRPPSGRHRTGLRREDAQ